MYTKIAASLAGIPSSHPSQGGFTKRSNATAEARAAAIKAVEEAIRKGEMREKGLMFLNKAIPVAAAALGGLGTYGVVKHTQNEYGPSALPALATGAAVGGGLLAALVPTRVSKALGSPVNYLGEALNIGAHVSDPLADALSAGIIGTTGSVAGAGLGLAIRSQLDPPSRKDSILDSLYRWGK